MLKYEDIRHNEESEREFIPYEHMQVWVRLQVCSFDERAHIVAIWMQIM